MASPSNGKHSYIQTGSAVSKGIFPLQFACGGLAAAQRRRLTPTQCIGRIWYLQREATQNMATAASATASNTAGHWCVAFMTKLD
jgi:hypothetical protein